MGGGAGGAEWARSVAGAAGLLAHPVRVLVLCEWPLDRLIEIEELAAVADCRPSEARYHLRVLTDAGALEPVADSTGLALSPLGRRLAIAAGGLARAVETAESPAGERLDRDMGAGAEDPRSEGPPPTEPPEPDGADARELAEPSAAELEGRSESLEETGAARQPRASPGNEPLGGRRAGWREQLLGLIQERPGVTIGQAAEELGASSTNVLLGPARRLIADGLVIRDGQALRPAPTQDQSG